MSHVSLEPAADAPAVTKDVALQYFIDGCTPKSDHAIGTECEYFLVDPATLAMRSYTDVTHFMLGLAERGGWSCEYEGENLLALKRNGAVIALEPGGQLEYATAPLPHVNALHADMKAFYNDARVVASDLGHNLLSMGMHPFEDYDSIPLIPKKRYDVMAPRLEEVGPQARTMMRATCGWQCAVDYATEQDFIERFQTFFHVTSLISAIYANSAWRDGRYSGLATQRVLAWLKTDAVRTGLIKDVFGGTFGFEAYYERAIDIPMLFIMRGGEWVNVRDTTFRQFMEHGYDGHYATNEDWVLHLTTMFPEARLKNFIEVRCADANRFDWLESFPSIILGLLEESSLMAAARDVTKHLQFRERLELHDEIAKHGLGARLGKYGVHELAGELVAIAREGLKVRGFSEERYLEPISEYGRNYVHAVPEARVSRTDLSPYLLLPMS